MSGLAFAELTKLALALLGQPHEQIPAFQFVLLAKNEVAEEAFQRLKVTGDPLKRIVIVRPDERIAEIPRVLREYLVCRGDSHRPQILYCEDGYRARIALAEGMNLPYSGDKPREVTDDFPLALACVAIALLFVEVVFKSLLDDRSVSICHAVAAQNPLALSKINFADKAGISGR